ncbi:peptidoglycan DD-metalloendopeptidase family protein [Psychroserpens sp.]|uniref:M23 family metallopeptidase n=1 Tax=Psychroserpens sp. TaxID=2020870 RepID=UPI003C73356F
MQPKQLVKVLLICLGFFSCQEDKKEPIVEPVKTILEPEPAKEFGFILDDFIVKRDTIKKGDSFGEILERYNIGYPQIFNIAEKTKDTFDIRRLSIGRPYTLLFSEASQKDSLPKPNTFIFQPDEEQYVVINLGDSSHAYTRRKPVSYVEKIATGVIESSISKTLEDKGLSQRLAYKMADEIYAWTIDFRRLQKGDRFKVIYTDKYIDDTVYVGIQDVKAAYFEHNGDALYAFEFETDSINGIIDYFNEDAKNLRRAFLKAPVQFSRISSRYNLKRRIAHYGYRVKAHRGTDFAAPNGTPILATANGTVSKSSSSRGNGKYVKIRHNDTYSTQYLHMSRRAVKKGQFVKQGEVIGYVGNTGSSSGNHVCYRFWKNGKEVDPFKQKLPEAKPISDSLKVKYLRHIQPIKQRLDAVIFLEVEPEYEETTIKTDPNS